MSITKSYNKHTDTYYAYDTTYVWDERSQRKVQKKVCIGQYDPETGEVIPNAKRGRPSKPKTLPQTDQQPLPNGVSVSKDILHELPAVIAEMDEIETSISALDERFRLLKDRILSLQRAVPEGSSFAVFQSLATDSEALPGD